MNIIAGTARNLELAVPQGLQVRPTSGKARKALFDSLGDLSGITFVDLCSGSGANALEAASRGAACAVMVEMELQHTRIIQENIRRVQKTGVDTAFELIKSDILNVAAYRNFLEQADVIYADPPYAVSAELCSKLLADSSFTAAANGCLLIWEIPDTPGAAGDFITLNGVEDMQLRRLGGTMFLTGKVIG